MNRIFTPKRIALSVAAALLQISSASAQTPPAQAEPKPEATDQKVLNLDQMVITGTSTAGTKMRQSLSVSTLNADQITQQGATNAAELLRSIPGIRSESSGGEGNANITARGAPISAGGSRYVQIQEDGLPLLLFGDIAFGTSDQFLRADFNVDRLEVVRGGSASTLATNSPGGIINFISKTGDEPGGAVGLTLGLGRKQTRADFDYGGKLADATNFHIGGFYRVGEGGRPLGYNGESGGQIKANITQKFDGGYVRLNVKALNDHTPTLLPVPVRTVNGKIEKVAGIDPRTAYFISNNFPRDTTIDANGNPVTNDPKDGLKVQSSSIGAEGQYKFADGWAIEDRFRTGGNKGRFMGLFPPSYDLPTNTFTGVLFNTSLDKLDNTFNDFKVTKSFSLGGKDKVNLTGGYFYGKQDVALTWFWNTYRLTLNNKNAQVVDAAGNPSTAPVTPGYGTFGGCCVRNFNVQYTSTAPYFAAGFDMGDITVDASVRRDNQKAKGFARQDNPANGAVVIAPGFDDTTRQTVNYKVAHTSYSVGGNYALDKNLALFARASDGVSFSADRLLYGTPLDGSAGININTIRQQEAGMKWRSGTLNAFVTLFNADTKESNFEATSQLFTNNKYNAKGMELELGWRAGDFRVNAGATFTRAKIKAANDATTIGKTPRRQADFTYQITPSYAFGDQAEVGAAIIGTGESWGDDGNTIRLPAFAVVNAFANYLITPKIQLSLGINNLFNTLGYTEVEGSGSAARAVNGRTAKASVKYSF